MKPLLPRLLVGLVLAGTVACATGGDAPSEGKRAAAAQTNRFTPTPPSGPAAVFFPRVGNPTDDDHGSLGPGLAFMGGALAPLGAFAWAHDVVTRGDMRAAGDVVVLSTVGDDAYSAALFASAAFNSVQTVLVPEGASAEDLATVAHRLETVEIVFLVDQPAASYERWAGTPLANAVREVWTRGGVLVGSGGGARALGAAVLVDGDTVTSEVALADPYVAALALHGGVFGIPFLAGSVVELKTRSADRFGRLAALSARMIADGFASSAGQAMGIGIDDGVAMTFDYVGNAGLLADTSSISREWLLHGGPADRVASGQPLQWQKLLVTRLDAVGESFDVVQRCGTAFTYGVAVDGAMMPPFTPADPYEAQGMSSPCP